MKESAILVLRFKLLLKLFFKCVEMVLRARFIWKKMVKDIILCKN